MLSYATHIRASLIEARDPQYVKDLLAVSGEQWYGPAQANLGHYVAPSPGQICINSSYRCASDPSLCNLNSENLIIE